MIQITKEDNAFPLFTKLSNKERMGLVETADIMKELVEILQVTSTEARPALNGSTIQFVSEQLKIPKSVISQYLSISNIRSNPVKQSLITSGADMNKAYYISRIKGKTFPEIEALQLEEIGRIHPHNEVLIHKMKTAQMILKNISKSKSIPFTEINYQNANTAPKMILENIEKCISIIAPHIQKVKILSEQLSYCNFLLTHSNCECITGSIIDPQILQQKKEAIIDEILLMSPQIMGEKKYISLLMIAKKDLEIAIKN